MTRIIKFLLSAAPALTAGSKLQLGDSARKERPIMKVVRLLQDMSTELNKEMEDDKQVHEMLSCWCETNDKDKKQAIEIGTATMSQLDSSMDEKTATMVRLTEKRKTTLDDVNKNHASLAKATKLRIEENKAFQGEETDLVEAIKACKQAVVVLGQHHPELAQLRTVAAHLQDARIPSLLFARTGMRGYKLEMLKQFLTQAQGATSFLGIPGFQSYAPQSGQIFGILKQMQADFEASLKETQKTEMTASANYESLKSAKNEEIAAGRQAIIQIDTDLADFSEKHAQEAKAYQDTKDQLELDQAFLADLTDKCSASESEYDTRVKDRSEEIAAVEGTIKILNSDGAYDVFDRSVNAAFLQKTLQTSERSRREKAKSLLDKLTHTDPKIALLAASAGLDTFEKVKTEIDKIVAELGKQQSDEVAHRDWCTSEIAANDRETSAADDKHASLQTKIADGSKTVDALKTDIAAAQASISEMQAQMKRASEVREAENADFQQTIADQRETQMILKKAVSRMKQVYALMQQQPGAAHTATSGTHTDAGNGPARFTEYGKNAGGARVVALLESVITDSVKTEDDSIAAEDDAQTSYESFMKDSNKLIKKTSESITNKSESMAKSKASLSMAKDDLKRTTDDLSDLSQTLGDVHKSCDFVLDNFDARQAARTAEMDALKEAKAILSGMK